MVIFAAKIVVDPEKTNPLPVLQQRVCCKNTDSKPVSRVLCPVARVSAIYLG